MESLVGTESVRNCSPFIYIWMCELFLHIYIGRQVDYHKRRPTFKVRFHIVAYKRWRGFRRLNVIKLSQAMLCNKYFVDDLIWLFVRYSLVLLTKMFLYEFLGVLVLTQQLCLGLQQLNIFKSKTILLYNHVSLHWTLFTVMLSNVLNQSFRSPELQLKWHVRNVGPYTI